ncbi:Death domain-associated protein 6 [Eufriesea mexicana]|uniref:protein PFC0760c-like n=1 Tax=Eufriesea mexicana TaxID=516756 RepID=UPI00083BA7EF|nr:PREDICTED: protein PFC0760c-like [Eufriesea mexicana]OAD60480.1 Death domain-associated protein 6 [Eufriesea mexicana]
MESKKDEIICISSDDDENIKQNKTDHKQKAVIEMLEDIRNSHVKREVSSSGNEKTKERGIKRKLSAINSDDDSYLKNHTKVFVCEIENNIKTCNVARKEKKESGKEAEKGMEENKTLLKPKLIEKERKTIFSVEQDIFPMFISLCLQKDRSEDMKIIVNKLKRRYEQLDPIYANSEAFINFLNEKRNDIMNSKSKLFIYIAEVMNEMKSSCKGKSTLLLNDKGCISGGNKLNRNNNSNVPTAMCSNMSHMINNVVSDNEIMLTNTGNEENQEANLSKQKKINVILKAMEQCEKRIKKLEEMEINFDDENNSNYIKLEKYKYRMVELYNKYCDYTGENTDAERQYLRPKHFSTTGIVAVDHAITSFINSKISKRNKVKKIGAFMQALIFPDYSDILKCVTKCNELHNLGLDNKQQHKIAKKAFIDLGEYLQRCRRNDYWDTFSLYLENTEDDPALKDMALAEKLVQNKRVGEKKLLNVFEEYVKKQEEMKDTITNSRTSSENEEDEDSVENDNEDDNENDNEDDNEDDDVSEIDINSDIDKDKSSSYEDENSIDGGDVSRNDINKKTKSSAEKSDPDIIEIEETQPTEINDRLKGSGNVNVKLIKVNDTVNISNHNCNLDSESKMENDTISSSDTTSNLNTSSNTVFSTITQNKISISRTKEDEPNIMNEDSMDDKLLKDKEEETVEKPLLRVRSFAKPPVTWKDVQEKVDEYNERENTSKTLTNKDIIDLTQENATLRQCATIQIGSKVLPIVKGNYKTFVIPAGNSIINVKNITNNYVRLNTKPVDSSNVTKLESGQIISTQRVIGKNAKSATIHLSSNVPANQEINTDNQIQKSQTKQKSTTLQISQSNQIIVLPSKREESTSQRPKTNSSMSQPK